MVALPLDDQRYLAWCGVRQWAAAVVHQAAEVTRADTSQRLQLRDMGLRLAFHSQCDFFATACFRLLQYREWALELGLFSEVVFQPLQVFSDQDIIDLRNMREHVIGYYKGDGHYGKRWFKEMPEFTSDASSRVGNLIGGRLDWIAFGQAVAKMLPAILAEPMPLHQPITNAVGTADIPVTGSS